MYRHVNEISCELEKLIRASKIQNLFEYESEGEREGKRQVNVKLKKVNGKVNFEVVGLGSRVERKVCETDFSK